MQKLCEQISLNKRMELLSEVRKLVKKLIFTVIIVVLNTEHIISILIT